MPKCPNCGHITFKAYDGRCADCEIVRLKNELSQARKESDDLKNQNVSINNEKKAVDAKYDDLFDEYAKLREKYDRTVFKLQQTKNDDPSIRFDFKEKPSTEPTTSGIKRRRHNTQSIVSANQVVQTEACPVESDPVSRANIMMTSEGFALSDEQASAVKLLESSKDNFFITGKAGTGKSAVLRYFRAHTKKAVAVVAPTGIAAINVNGQTIHSFFGLAVSPMQDVEDPSLVLVPQKKKEIMRYLDAIIIDEISMVRADVMDMIDRKLKYARENDLPFGGCQLIVFGDLYQLPPVGVRKENKEILKLFHDRYPESSFFFGSSVVADHPFRRIELNEVHRQKDEKLISILNAIRIGSRDRVFLDAVNQCAAKQAPDNCITLTTKNSAVDVINKQKLDAILSTEYVYRAEVHGKFSSEAFPAPEDLHLKAGAFVIMLVNDEHWVNGSTGVIKEISENQISVDIDGITCQVNKKTWSNYVYTYNQEKKKIEQTEIGSFTQYPMKLAYAITIHKSQGQTYDKVVVDYADENAFAPGQTYVALSRCRSMDGLYLKHPLSAEDIKVSQDVLNYMNKTSQTSGANNSNSDPWFERAVDGQSQEEIDKYNEALAGCEPIDKVARGEGFEIDDDGHWNYIGDRRDYDD